MTLRSPFPDGFTLLEVMISTTILALLALLLVSMIGQINTIWVSADQRVENFQNGRAVLEIISRELAGASNSATMQFVQNPGDPATGLSKLLLSGTQTGNSDSIFWQAPLASTSSTTGALYSVGYFVTNTPVSGTNSTALYQLQRFYSPITSATTPTSLYTAPPSPYNNFTSAAVASPAMPKWSPGWIYLGGSVTTGTSAFQQNSAVVSDGIVAFWVRCLDINGNPIPWLSTDPTGTNATPMKFNSAATFQMPALGGSGTLIYSGTSTLQANQLPDFVEITLVTVDSRALKNPSVPGLIEAARAQSNNPAVTGATAVPASIQTFMSTLTSGTTPVSSAHLFSTTVRLMSAPD